MDPMSQQEMHHQEPRSTNSESPYAGYDGTTPNDPPQSSFSGFYGQKLAEPASTTPSATQRLALAIVSLCLLMATTIATIAIGVFVSVGVIGAFGLMFVLVLFYAAVIVINVLFNRRA
jgi:hypothetical protein